MQQRSFTILLGAACLAALSIVTLALPQPATAAPHCIRIQRQGDIETLVNICGACRIASLIRSRPGNEVPVGRQFNVQAHSTFPVPFRGPGRTRVTSERPCPGEPGADQDLLQQSEAQQQEKSCVSMERSPKLGVVLVNRCGICRAVAIQRVTADGKNGVRDYMLVAGGSRVPVSAKGFAQVGLLGDIDCPKN